MQLPEKIKALRLSKGIKQSDIAEALGTERTNYHRIENRGDKMSLEQLEKIARALGITLIDLLTYGESFTYADSPERMAELERQINSLQDENRELAELLAISKGRDEMRREMAKESYQSMVALSKKMKGHKGPEVRYLFQFVEFLMKFITMDEEDSED